VTGDDADMVPAARRTQAERRADTTAKLLDATAGALIDLGYAGASTTEVCRRAGVSRGALLHHYPTKDELVAAAVAHIVDLRVEEFQATLATLPDDASVVERLETAIDVLWSIYKGPTVAAWTELAVAARTDPELRRHLETVDQRFDERTRTAWAQLFPDTDALPDGFYEVAPSFMFAVLHGLAVERMTGTARAEVRAELVLLTVKVIVRTLAEADPAIIQRQIDALMEDLR
jgi:AcrR family transcriptional regulator